MPNNLNALQHLAFAGPDMPIEQVHRTAELIDPVGITTDITADINSFGTLFFGLYNLHPANRGSSELPTMQWKVLNDDLTYTPGNVGGVWNPYQPSEFKMRLTIVETITTNKFTPQDPTNTWPLMEMEFQVREVNLVGEEAGILGTNLASFLMDRVWKETDGEDIDWSAVGGPSGHTLRPF